MSDMTGATDNLVAGDSRLGLIERGGTEVTPAFVEAFRAMSPEQQNIWVEDARRNVMASEFGWAASFMDDPELSELFRKALGPPMWAEAKFLREFRKTKWWNDRDNNQRAWDQGIASDPATYNRQIDVQSRGIKETASAMNLVLTDDQIRELATESLRSKWNDVEIFNAVANEGVKGGLPGADLRFGITGRGVRQLASEYAVPLSQEAADDYAQKIATGAMSQTDFENILRRQAKGMYPSLSDDIDRGVTVSTLTDPYRQVAATTLGISSAEIDFADPRWNAALNFDDGKGRRAMTLYEWGQHLRTNEQYGYDRTPDARNKAYSMTDRLGRAFGVTA